MLLPKASWRAFLVAGSALAAAASPAHGAEPAATVALVLDTSGSLSEASLAQARRLATGLIEGLPAGSEIAVFTFDDQARLVLPRTSNAADVRRALGQARRQGRFTALHDALYDASRYLRDSPGARRAIVLLTDGRDENSALQLDDGLRVAQETGIPVFAVGLGQVEERVLRRIAKLTGGDFVPGAAAQGAVLAGRLLSAAPPRPPAARETAGASPAGPARPPVPPPSPAARPPRVADGMVWRPALLIGAGVALLGVAVLSMLVLRRRSQPRRCPNCGRELAGALAECAFCASRKAAPAAASRPAGDADTPVSPRQKAADTARFAAVNEVSDTLLERYNITEEYLEKTVTLREHPVLTVTKGSETGRVFRLSDAAPMSIGRAKANDIVLDDLAVSSQHCRVRAEDGHFVVHDLKSTNGTFVNEQRVARHLLGEGDVLQVGETHLRFHMERQRA
jgi:hypothetical protein